MLVRIKYSKLGDISYISHLDIIKLMERIVRRTGLKLSYSEGFNPHMKLSFAVAKGVGLPSDGELLEIQTIEGMDEASALLALNQVLPEGIEALGLKEREKGKSLSALLKRSRYLCTFKGYRESIESFLNQDEILLTLKTKKGPKEKEVKELIYHWQIAGEGEDVLLDLTLAAGSEKNLRIDAFVDGLCKGIGYEGEIGIKRISLLGEEGLLFDAV